MTASELAARYLREWRHGMAEPEDLHDDLTLKMIGDVIEDFIRYADYNNDNDKEDKQ
mgnify:CR=1 FL=1|tara:strand:+ start:4057 stop:4227 length:171 start_codon:yes stop_codon:yes gene_type:complete